MKLILQTVIVVLLLFVGTYARAAESQPNILLIMVDDLGFSDLGCYGSEIETPHLDALAAQGLRFSQFYNTAKCHSSRVSLLTGEYCIAAGDTKLTNAVTSAEVLAKAGYFTAMTGKWHLTGQPTEFGFQRYFGHLSGACNYFSGDNTFRLNGEPWSVPKQGFYTTTANVDYALKFLGEARQVEKPWFMYIAFNAPHAPLHALPEDYAKYKGRYDQGWDQVRAARVAKQKKIGLLPTSLLESPRPDHIPAWDAMEPWRQKYEANRMTTLAAMIDRVDQEVGRLIDDLRTRGELNNTLILFVSDNGACPYDRKSPVLDVEPTDGSISLPDSTGWAWMRNSPFRFYKQNQFEGGIATPGIVHWPAGLKTQPGAIVDEPAHLIDVLPTLADIAGCKIPAEWPGRDLRPVSGVSLAQVFQGGSLDRLSPIHLLFAKDRGLRDGDWKIVSFQNSPWELYNVADDRTELHELSASDPSRLQQMVETWTNMARDVLHAKPNAYAPVKQTHAPHRHPEWTNFSSDVPGMGKAKKRNRLSRSGETSAKIRARKNTKLTIKDGMLLLEFTGEDPGIALDLGAHELPNGPYRLTFQLRDGSPDGGELFYTTEPEQTLPKGKRLSFPVTADGEWQAVSIDLPLEDRLYQLRIDVSSGPGKGTIAELQLRDHQGKPIMTWPRKEKK